MVPTYAISYNSRYYIPLWSASSTLAIKLIIIFFIKLDAFIIIYCYNIYNKI